MSRQLPTRPLPVAPVPIGYCGRNRRFVLRIYFHIEQSLEPHLYFTRKPYSSSKRGFCVRATVALWPRNVRDKIRSADRVRVQSATESSPKAVRIRAVTVAASSPRPCPGRVRDRNQSASESRPQSVRDRVQSTTAAAAANCPHPQSVHSRTASTASPRPYSVHDQSGDMTHGSRSISNRDGQPDIS